MLPMGGSGVWICLVSWMWTTWGISPPVRVVPGGRIVSDETERVLLSKGDEVYVLMADGTHRLPG